MSNITLGILGLIALLILVFLGIHVHVALGVVGIVGMTMMCGFDRAIAMSANVSYYKMASFSNSAIPLFILLGMLASCLGASKGCYDALRRFVGKLPGGLGIATVLASAAFGALNGSGTVTASVFTKCSVPSMKEVGYDKKLAYGVVCGSANLGQLIPPSVTVILIGAITGESISAMLVGAIQPAIYIILANSLICFAIACLRPNLMPRDMAHYTWAERIKGLVYVIPVAISALIIVGGMSSGTFTGTEAGAVGVVVFFIYGLIMRVPLKQMLQACVDTISSLVMIFILMVTATIFANFLTLSGVVGAFADILLAHELPKWGFLLITALIIMVLGCFMDAGGVITLSMPILYPTAIAMGVPAMQFCLVALVTILAGAITPPVGLVCFTVKGLAGDDIELMDVFKGAVPFLIGILVVVVAMCFVPVLTGWLA